MTSRCGCAVNVPLQLLGEDVLDGADIAQLHGLQVIFRGHDEEEGGGRWRRGKTLEISLML